MVINMFRNRIAVFVSALTMAALSVTVTAISKAATAGDGETTAQMSKPENAPHAEAVKAPPKAVEQRQPNVADVEKKKRMIKEAKEKLNNLTWSIDVSQLGTEGKKDTYKDTLHFVENKVNSEKLTSEGFPSTNYTVSIQGGVIVVWETMQTSEKSGLAFWKGELEGDTMRGVLSRHLDEKIIRDFSFVSTSKGAPAAPAKTPEAPKPVAPVVPAAPAVPQAATPAPAVETALTPAPVPAPAEAVKVESKAAVTVAPVKEVAVKVVEPAADTKKAKADKKKKGMLF